MVRNGMKMRKRTLMLNSLTLRTDGGLIGRFWTQRFDITADEKSCNRTRSTEMISDRIFLCPDKTDHFAKRV